MNKTLSSIKAAHAPAPNSSSCRACAQAFPCDASIALEEVTRLEIENAHLDNATIPLQAETGWLRSQLAAKD